MRNSWQLCNSCTVIFWFPENHHPSQPCCLVQKKKLKSSKSVWCFPALSHEVINLFLILLLFCFIIVGYLEWTVRRRNTGPRNFISAFHRWCGSVGLFCQSPPVGIGVVCHWLQRDWIEGLYLLVPGHGSLQENSGLIPSGLKWRRSSISGSFSWMRVELTVR